MLTIEKTAKAINDFAENLKNSADMTDRQNSVTFLAREIGPEAAQQVAAIFGLKNNYYLLNTRP